MHNAKTTKSNVRFIISNFSENSFVVITKVKKQSLKGN